LVSFSKEISRSTYFINIEKDQAKGDEESDQVLLPNWLVNSSDLTYQDHRDDLGALAQDHKWEAY